MYMFAYVEYFTFIRIRSLLMVSMLDSIFVYINPLVISKYTSSPRKLFQFPFLPIYKDIDQDLLKS